MNSKLYALKGPDGIDIGTMDEVKAIAAGIAIASPSALGSQQIKPGELQHAWSRLHNGETVNGYKIVEVVVVEKSEWERKTFDQKCSEPLDAPLHAARQRRAAADDEAIERLRAAAARQEANDDQET